MHIKNVDVILYFNITTDIETLCIMVSVFTQSIHKVYTKWQWIKKDLSQRWHNPSLFAGIGEGLVQRTKTGFQ